MTDELERLGDEAARAPIWETPDLKRIVARADLRRRRRQVGLTIGALLPLLVAGAVVLSTDADPEPDVIIDNVVDQPLGPDETVPESDETEPAPDEDSGPDGLTVWEELDAGPLTPRSGAVLLSLDDELLVIGGERHSDGAIYTPASDTWRLVADPPFTGRPAVVWTGTVAYAIGSAPNGEDRVLAAYDPTTDGWTDVATVRGDAANPPFDQLLWTGDEVLVMPDLVAADPATGELREIPPLPAESGLFSGGHVATWTGSGLVLVAYGRDTFFLPDGQEAWNVTPGPDLPLNVGGTYASAIVAGDELVLVDEIDQRATLDLVSFEWSRTELGVSNTSCYTAALGSAESAVFDLCDGLRIRDSDGTWTQIAWEIYGAYSGAAAVGDRVYQWRAGDDTVNTSSAPYRSFRAYELSAGASTVTRLTVPRFETDLHPEDGRSVLSMSLLDGSRIALWIPEEIDTAAARVTLAAGIVDQRGVLPPIRIDVERCAGCEGSHGLGIGGWTVHASGDGLDDAVWAAYLEQIELTVGNDGFPIVRGSVTVVPADGPDISLADDEDSVSLYVRPCDSGSFDNQVAPGLRRRDDGDQAVLCVESRNWFEVWVDSPRAGLDLSGVRIDVLDAGPRLGAAFQGEVGPVSTGTILAASNGHNGDTPTVRGYARDSGRPLWEVDLDTDFPAFVHGAGPELFVAAGQFGPVFAINPTDGAILWEQPLDGEDESPGSATVSDNGSVVYLTTSFDRESDVRAPRVRALDAGSGEVIWDRSLDDGTDLQWGSPAVTEELVILAETYSHPGSVEAVHVHALDRRSGERVWEFDLETSNTGFHDLPILVADETAVVRSASGAVIAIDVVSGSEKWQLGLPFPDSWAIVGDTLVAGDTCVALDDGVVVDCVP